jgi:hypothetical protein
MPGVKAGGQGAGEKKQTQSNMIKTNFFLPMRNKVFSHNDYN